MLAEQLKAFRKKRKISQASLANVLGISQQAVAKWEQNKAEPSASTLITLAKQFDVTVDDLLGYQAVVSVFSDDEKELVEEYRRLNDNDKITIRLMVNRLRDTEFKHPHSMQNVITQKTRNGDNLLFKT